MAGMCEISAAGVLEKISQGHLECPICFSRFTNPKILNCLHSFCQRCLEKMMEGHPQQRELTCPVCRQQTALSDAGIAGILNNFSLMALVDEVTQQEELVKSQRSQIICEECDEKEEAMARCLACRKYLCDVCHNAHRRSKQTKNHETASIDDLRSGKAPYQSRLWNEVPKCPKHSSQDLYFFCETCKTLICAACTALDHKAPDHKLSDISKATALCKEKVDQLEREAEQRLAKLKDAKATAENSHTNHKVKTTEIQSAISKKADEEVAKIRKVERLLKNNLIHKDKEFEDIISKYRERVENMETTMESVQTVRSQANDYDLLRHQQNLLQNLQLATEIVIPDPVQGLTPEDLQQCKNFTDSDLEKPPSFKSTDLEKYSDLLMDTGEVKLSHPGKCTLCSQNLNTTASSQEHQASSAMHSNSPPSGIQQLATGFTPRVPRMSGPEQARRMQVGTRVIRGPDWCYGNEDRPQGRVTWIDVDEGWVDVEWYLGLEIEGYRMGAEGKYDLQMVKYADDE